MSTKHRTPKPENNTLKSGNLKVHTWRRFLRGPDPALLEDLYVPALSEAIQYARCCSYFSSTVLSAAARGFGKMIERLQDMGSMAPKPAVRLLVNEELHEDDVKAMTETGDLKKLEAILQRRFKNPTDILEKQRLAMLAWLVRERFLEVKVGVMRRGGGIVHAKFGIVSDEAGQAIVFSGSGNESAQGLLNNYERLEVSTSWEDPERHQEYLREFESLWKDMHPDVHTVTLPEALRLRLVKFAPKEAPIVEPTNALARQKAAMTWQFIVEAPYFEQGGAACDATAMVDLWPHQRRVVEETVAAWPDGRLLCDEVGMGKTIEAILVLRRLMAGRGVKRILILLPAALLRQWQAELREKGGMIFPRLEGTGTLVWPDDTTEKVRDLSEALAHDALIMSRETARMENNLPMFLQAEPWDLVILDESHAARRRKQEEGEYNSGTLLLNLMRQLQLNRRSRGFLFLSATPMQTHPWEPWDLLAVLGEGGKWLADFANVRSFYEAAVAVKNGRCNLDIARKASSIIADDDQFPPPLGETKRLSDKNMITQRLAFVAPTHRTEIADWLRSGSPLARRMHRNTKETLRAYHRMGLLNDSPPRRVIDDRIFDYEDASELRVYTMISGYIQKRYEELESEKPGKGFVMTIYRRRATSSPFALEKSLLRRKEGLQRVIGKKAYDYTLSTYEVPEALIDDDLPEIDETAKISSAFPQDPQEARNELVELERVLEQLQILHGKDTKRDLFYEVLRQVTDDGRSVLVFTEYRDTLEYLRNNLVSYYGKSLGCYSGAGGERWNGEVWQTTTKDAITKALSSGELQVLVCTDAASEGLNLQAAGAVVNYDLPWNPGKVEQRIGRIDRIGQKQPEIRVVNLFLANSVDEKVYRALRVRCGLFEHFVGPMQPVLARARKMLLGEEGLDLHIFDTTAKQVEQDPVAIETYIESTAQEGPIAAPALNRQQLKTALMDLKGEFGPRTKANKGSEMLQIIGLSRAKTVFGATIEALERDRTITPLSPFDKKLRELSELLTRPGENLPLVIGSFQRGAFRSSVAYWVDAKERIPISSLEELHPYVEKWDGTYPDGKQWLRAKHEAQVLCEKTVSRLEQNALEKEKRGIKQQLEAARLRLQVELGRYLACLGFGMENPNGVLYQQMTRDIVGAQRPRKCLEKLEGYPEWPPDFCRELELFAESLTDNQCKARLMGKEVDAAIDDPRWIAKL